MQTRCAATAVCVLFNRICERIIGIFDSFVGPMRTGYAGIVLVLMACAVLAIFSIVPHAQSPDEGAHMMRAASLAHGKIVLQSDGKTIGDVINNGQLEYYGKLSSLAFHPEKKVTTLENLREIRYSDSYTRCDFSSSAVYFPGSYIPQAVAILVGEKFHLKVWRVVNLAKALNLVAIFGMLALAARLWRLPLLTAVLLLMPMTLFQTVCPSTDGVHFAMTVLIASLFLHLSKRYSGWGFIGLCVLIFILATHRMNMFVLMVLPFWLGVRNKSRFQIGVSLLTVFLGVAWILFAMSTIPRPDRSFGMVQIALYYLMHPVETIKAFFHTFTDIGLLKFYRDSFAGQLGWLDYCVSKGVIYLTHVLVWGALIYGCIRSKFLTTWRSEGGFLFIVAIGSALSTFFFLLVQWTPFPCAGAIAGVQGRYLIAPFMLLGFATEYTWVVSRAHETRNVRVILSLALIAYGVLSIVATQSATLSRYWIS